MHWGGERGGGEMDGEGRRVVAVGAGGDGRKVKQKALRMM